MKKPSVSWHLCHKATWDREGYWQCYELQEREELQVAWQAPAGLSQRVIYLWQSESGGGYLLEWRVLSREMCKDSLLHLPAVMFEGGGAHCW